MRTHQRRLLARLAKTLDRGSWRKQTPLHRSNQAQTRLPFVRWSDSPGESKYHPPHPTVMQRLARIDDQLRFRGYSVVRIGLGILLVAGENFAFVCPMLNVGVVREIGPVASLHEFHPIDLCLPFFWKTFAGSHCRIVNENSHSCVMARREWQLPQPPVQTSRRHLFGCLDTAHVCHRWCHLCPARRHQGQCG